VVRQLARPHMKSLFGATTLLVLSAMFGIVQPCRQRRMAVGFLLAF
jgi:hypothetical protein